MKSFITPASIDKSTPLEHLVERMQALGFELAFEGVLQDQSSKTNTYYLFVHPSIGACTMETYGDSISDIRLYVNFQFHNPQDFNHKFFSGNWSYSTGAYNGYGDTLKCGTIRLHTDLAQLMEEMAGRGRFVFPWETGVFLVNSDVVSNSEKYIIEDFKNPKNVNVYFLEHKVSPRHAKMLASRHGEPTPEQQNTFIAWNELIEKSRAYLPAKKIPRADKAFYTTCKEIILGKPESWTSLTDTGFLHHTTGLGHNFTHLMAVTRNSHTKDFLYAHFKALPLATQGTLVNHNDLNGFNALLILAQQSRFSAHDQGSNLHFFKHLLKLPNIQESFFNPQRSLLDVMYDNSKLNTGNCTDYLRSIHEAGLDIPLVYHQKDNSWDSVGKKEKIRNTLHGSDILQGVGAEAYQFINSCYLNKKLAHQLQETKDDPVQHKAPKI